MDIEKGVHSWTDYILTPGSLHNEGKKRKKQTKNGYKIEFDNIPSTNIGVLLTFFVNTCVSGMTYHFPSVLSCSTPGMTTNLSRLAETDR